MTPDYFERQIERLRPLGAVSDEFKDGYWEALRDIPPRVFEAAIGYALKTRAWFPKPAELRADADHVAPLAVLDAPLPVQTRELEQPFTITIPEAGIVKSITREWVYYCDACSDTGWMSFWCGAPDARRQTWIVLGRCARPQAHGPHEYVQHCACWASNPALVRKREAMRKYAAEPQKVA